MEIIFFELAAMLLIAFVISYIVKIFRQPIIVGYIIAGMLITPFIIYFGASQDVISLFSEFGIALLLFMVGLHLNPKVIKEVGTSSLLIGLGQMILTFALGFLISTLVLGFSVVVSVYVGIAMMFSSTIIVMKLLSDKKQLDSLYGKISIGVLIIQDLVAIAVLIVISTMSGGVNEASFALTSLLWGLGLIIILFLIGYFVLPKLTRSIAKSQELLFLFAIAWCFVIAALFSYFGFSLEIGALIAGVVLAISPYSTEISSKIKPLRDFFLVIFFVILGLNIQLSSIGSIIINAIILSLIALIAKPIILMSLSALFSYTKRTNFFVGTTLAQISEFSLIVLTLGLASGHISSEIVSTLTLTAVITITLSTYLIIYSQQIYERMNSFASIFEKRKVRKRRKSKEKYNAILFGYNRIGFGILRSLKRLKRSYLVVDFNPDTIADLSKLRIPCLYGDAYDSDLLEDLPLKDVQIVVSTIPDFETNKLLAETIKSTNPRAVVILRAHTIPDALALYRKGANYVLTPHFLGGEYVSKMITHSKTKKSDYRNEKEKHIKMLEERKEKGHEHPEVES